MGNAHYTITVDGGALGNGTENVQCYGSALIETSCGKSRIIGWDDLPSEGTNNEAEFASLTLALQQVAHTILSAKRDPANYNVEVVMDSALVLNTVFGTWKVKAPNLRPYRRDAKNAVLLFGTVTHRKISGDEMKAILGH